MTAAAANSNVERICATRLAIGDASPTSVAVVRASASASARARNASCDRCAVRFTSVLTVPVTVTNTNRATRFSASPTVKVCVGGTKNQFVSRKAAMAVTRPMPVPPMAAISTQAPRNTSSVVERLVCSLRTSSTAVSDGRITTAAASAARRRRAEMLRCRRGRFAFGVGARSAPEMTWTSRSPALRRTRVTTEPRVTCWPSDPRLAPSTICVAFSPRAKVSSAAGTSPPTTSW